MQRDNYGATIERLLDLVEISQTDIRVAAQESLASFDLCLRDEFSKYLSGLRKIRGVLNKCYKRTNIVGSRKATTRNIGCDSMSRLNCVSL